MDPLAILRDIKKLVILAVFSDRELRDQLVLKGGNLLDVVYELSARASVDVDFSIDGDFDDPDAIHEKIEGVLSRAFAARGFVLFDFHFVAVPPIISDDLKDFWGGYDVDFKIIEKDKHKQFAGNLEQLQRNASRIGKRGSTVFKMDISRHEFCAEKEKFDVDNETVYGYSPAMFVAEKIRAICQQIEEYVAIVKSHARPRARDFIDIEIVARQYAIDFSSPGFHETVRRVFGQKRVPLKLIGEIHRHREQHEVDFPSVRDTVHPSFDLQPFDFYFDNLVRQSKQLKPLWNE